MGKWQSMILGETTHNSPIDFEVNILSHCDQPCLAYIARECTIFEKYKKGKMSCLISKDTYNVISNL